MSGNDEDSSSRRSFFGQVGSTGAAIAVAGGFASGVLAPGVEPAQALGGKLKRANSLLTGYGLPAITDLPDGFSPLVELYGKGANRDPLLVQFYHPVDWVVTLPNVDPFNGEDGTIQAGQYSAGDTATLFLLKENIDDISTQSKDFYRDCVVKAISQKGDNMYQNFKVTKVVQKNGEYKDQKYVIVDFKYELLTGAGFQVDRQGVASITNVGGNVEVLWAATIFSRYKKTEKSLRTITDSFRCYADGLKFSSSINGAIED